MIPSSGLLGSAHLVNISKIQHQLLNIEQSTKWAIHSPNSADIWWLDSNDHSQLGKFQRPPPGPRTHAKPVWSEKTLSSSVRPEDGTWRVAPIVSPRVALEVCCLQKHLSIAIRIRMWWSKVPWLCVTALPMSYWICWVLFWGDQQVICACWSVACSKLAYLDSTYCIPPTIVQVPYLLNMVTQQHVECIEPLNRGLGSTACILYDLLTTINLTL